MIFRFLLDKSLSIAVPGRRHCMYLQMYVTYCADATLFACLSFIRGAPVIHPQLRQQLESRRILLTYLEGISSRVFSQPIPSASSVDGLQWSQWGGGADDRHSERWDASRLYGSQCSTVQPCPPWRLGLHCSLSTYEVGGVVEGLQSCVPQGGGMGAWVR